MPFGKAPTSCLPCAKRKVRCDRLQPCRHCQRRPRDRCVYPNMTPEEIRNLPENQISRIHQLERQIRSLGGDPNDASPQQPGQSQQSGQQIPRTGVSPSAQDEAINNSTGVQASGLVTKDDEVTYIEAYVDESQPSVPTDHQQLTRRLDPCGTAGSAHQLPIKRTPPLIPPARDDTCSGPALF